MASSKTLKQKFSKIEQKAIEEIQKAFGIKVYSSRQKLKKALNKLAK